MATPSPICLGFPVQAVFTTRQAVLSKDGKTLLLSRFFAFSVVSTTGFEKTRFKC